jgi:uroporphyrinogen III methyltransferase/synthase
VTSATGARALGETLDRIGADARLLAGWRVASVGPATSDALRNLGLRPDLEPREATSAHLGEEMAARHGLRGRRVLLWQAEGATDDLADRLRAAGARIERAIAYRTARERMLPPAAAAALREGPVAGITFTSSSCVEAFLSLCPGDLRDAALGSAAFCIGPVTERTAREAGFRGIHVAAPHTVPGLVAAGAATLAAPGRPA